MNKDSIALPGDVADTVRRALREDIGSGDVTACLIPHGRIVSASVV
jgi:nicotinate-nucleotide pyrophosphorylase